MKNIAMQIPEWLRKSAVYQVNPRTFSPEGTISAVTKELPKLKELGFRIVYLCPIFEEDATEDQAFWSPRQKASETGNPKNPYRMNDYFQVDEEYGTMADLRELVTEAHRLDMKVLLDLVYLHIGPNADILKIRPEYAKQHDDGSIKLNQWNFAVWDYSCKALREYLWCNMVYYIAALDVDGYRCDVGDGVPNDFWVEGRRRMQIIKPDAILINEGKDFYRLATSFDSCYDYDWHNQLYTIFTEAPADGLQALIDEQNRKFSFMPKGGYILHDFDNHDTVNDWGERGESLFGHDGMELVEVLNYSFPGVPMIYNGNEYADTTVHSMFANRFHMGRFTVTDRDTLRGTDAGRHRAEIMKTLNGLLLEKEAMSSPDVEWLPSPDTARILCFKRPDSTHPIVFIGNFSKDEIDTTVEFCLENARILMANKAELDGNKVTLGAYGYLLLEG